MKVIHYLFLLLLLILSYTIVAYTGTSLNKDVISLTATFYSITSGFMTTTVTLIFGSKLSRSLYLQLDKNQKKTKLHILKSYLIATTSFLIAGVVFSAIYLALPESPESINTILNTYANIILIFIFFSSIFLTATIFVFILKAMILAAVPGNKNIDREPN